MAEKPKRQRHFARVFAMQYLYAWSINTPEHLADDIRVFVESQEEERDYYSFGEELVMGVIENLDTIDGKIESMAANWDMARIAKLDLAILRMASFELLYRNDIPPIVSINEAIDLSKEYSSEESKRFINGILDRIKGELSRPSRRANTD